MSAVTSINSITYLVFGSLLMIYWKWITRYKVSFPLFNNILVYLSWCCNRRIKTSHQQQQQQKKTKSAIYFILELKSLERNEMHLKSSVEYRK